MSVMPTGAVPAWANPITWLGCGLGLAGFVLALWPSRTYGDLLAAGALICPALAFALLLMAPQAFGVTTRSGKRTINYFLIFPAGGLVAVGLGAHPLEQQYAILPAAVCALIAVMLGIGAAAQPLPGGRWSALLFLVLFGGAYGYGGMVFADTRFDHDPGQVYQAQVQRRYSTYSRHGQNYHLVLGPWASFTQPFDAGVSRAAYDALHEGDSACVTLHPGALRMPWYEVHSCY
jgi:hypothetical protein